MLIRFKRLLQLLTITLLVGCQGEVGAPGPAGPTLAINTINITPHEPSIGEIATAEVSYVVTEGVEVSVDWSVNGGTIVGTGAIAQWTTPTEPGDYTVSATIEAMGLSTVGHNTVHVTAENQGGENCLFPEIQIATWGSTGVIYTSHEDNLDFIHNLLVGLGGSDGNLRILYTDSCDPRDDPEFCNLSGDFSTLEPFFEMIGSLGTIEFSTMTSVDPTSFDLVIADFCFGLMPQSERTALSDYLDTGGKALVLAQRFCSGTIEAASEVMQDYGITFTDLDPGISQPMQIPINEQVGFLCGIDSLRIWRVTPQIISHSFQPVLSSDDGVLCAVLPVDKDKDLVNGFRSPLSTKPYFDGSLSRWTDVQEPFSPMRTRYDMEGGGDSFNHSLHTEHDY